MRIYFIGFVSERDLQDDSDVSTIVTYPEAVKVKHKFNK